MSSREATWALVLVDSLVWMVLSAIVGYVMHRVPPQRLERDGPFTTLRPFEQGGRWYERRLRMKRWKDRLPEAGGLFGGYSKRHIAGTGVPALRRFVIETRRAERTHWLLLACGPFFVLWNPWSLSIAMVGFAVVANLPCLIVQRYNRARLLRILGRAPADIPSV